MESNILKDKQLRVTPFREKVLKLFLETPYALSVQDIEDDLIEFDRITLYRTIKSFIEKGVIHEIVMPGDIKKMALCDDLCYDDEGIHSHHHIHFQCYKCHEIYCVEVDNFPKITLPGFTIEEREIQAKGICKTCNQKQ